MKPANNKKKSRFIFCMQTSLVTPMMFSLLFSGTANAITCATGLAPGSAHPEFTFDHAPLNQVAGSHGMPRACMREVSVLRDGNYGHGDGFHEYRAKTGQTPFLLQDAWFGDGTDETSWQIPQVVTDGTHNFYHIVMGENVDEQDENVGDYFKQEFYIRMGFPLDTAGLTTGGHYDPDHSLVSWSWATKISKNGNWGSASGGDSWIGRYNGSSKFISSDNNAYYPLQAPDGRDDGNGSGNPNMVIIRQKMKSGDLESEFLKDVFGTKPKILQTLNNAEINQVVEIDMRNLTYDPDNPQSLAEPTKVVLTQDTVLSDTYTDRWVYGDNAYENNSKLYSSAGKYTYTEGSGTLEEQKHGKGRGGAGGTYTYADAEFDIYAVEWEKYFDHGEANPWTNSGFDFTDVDYRPK